MRCVLCAMKDQKPFFMPLEIAEKPRIFGSPSFPLFLPRFSLGLVLRIGLGLNVVALRLHPFPKSFGELFSHLEFGPYGFGATSSYFKMIGGQEI